MDQAKHQTPHTLSLFIKPHFLKKITQLLLSISLFSIFFSYSSWLSFLLHSFKFYFSAYIFQIFSSTIYRNCIFLLCNGILVFLVRNSSLISSSLSSSDYSDEFFKKNGDDLQSESLVTETKELSLDIEDEEKSSGSLENVVEEGRDNEYMIEGEGETANSIAEHEEQETESWLLITKGREVVETVTENEKKEKGSESSPFFVEEEDYNDDQEEEEEEEEEEEVEYNDELLSTEELNKKFDDFIRRMKEEIRIEAQQHLVMVNY